MSRVIRTCVFLLAASMCAPATASACWFLPTPWSNGWCWNPFNPWGACRAQGCCGGQWGPGSYAAPPVGYNTFPPRPVAWGGSRQAHVPVTTYRNVTVDMGSYQQVWVPRLVTQQVPQVSYQPAITPYSTAATLPLNSPYIGTAASMPMTAPATVSSPSPWQTVQSGVMPSDMSNGAMMNGAMMTGDISSYPSMTSGGTVMSGQQMISSHPAMVPGGTTISAPQITGSTGGAMQYEDWTNVAAQGSMTTTVVPQSGQVPMPPPGTHHVNVTDPAPAAYERRSRRGLFSPVRPGSRMSRARHTGR